jgi:hypothetical protein
LRKGDLPWRKRYTRRTAAPITRRPTTPKTTERMIIRSRCGVDICPEAERMGGDEGETTEVELEEVARPVATLDVDPLIGKLVDVDVSVELGENAETGAVREAVVGRGEVVSDD